MTIIWTAEAEADRDRIWFFFAERDVARADRVEARLVERIDSLEGVPRQGRRVERTRRDLSVTDIQLVVRYRIDDDAIRILGVRHTRENRS